MLRARGLQRPGLAPADLELAAGEAVAVLGPSGSGKTLLLRAIADLDPSEGDVRLDDTPRESMPAPRWRRRVTYVPAEPGWWADDVAAHFDDLEAARHELPALKLPEDILERRVDGLSTGERHRLALLRAFLLTPRVLLLDEPTSGLDEAAAEAVETLLRERLKGGTGILFSTHDEAQARRLADRRLRIAAGRLESGVPAGGDKAEAAS